MDPIPTNASKASVHAFAERVAKSLSFGIGDPVEPVVTRLHGRIVFRDPVGFESNLPESIRVLPDQTFTIFLPTMTSVERDRFTIAHELGHFFLHYPLVRERDSNASMVATRWVDTTNSVQQRAEWEANWFAAAFLMPSAEFRTSYSRHGGSVWRVANQFAVSSQAAEVRARTLGLT